jgi:hypothetical protein
MRTPTEELWIWKALLQALRTIQQSIQSIDKHQQARESEKEPPSESNHEVVVSLPPAISEYYASEQSERPKKTRRDNIRLVLEIGGAAAAIGALVFTIRTLSEVKRQADTTQQQVSIMQKQLEATDRPWMTVDVTACTVCGDRDIRGGPLTFDKDGRGSLTFRITFKNVGKSAANHVTLRFKPLAVGFSDPRASIFTTPAAEQKQLCDGPSRSGTFDIGVVFPNDPQTEVFGPAGLDTNQIPNLPLALHLTNGKPIAPFLVGCVDYAYPYSSTAHQTGFIYSISEINPPHAIQTLMVIPVNRLAFEPYAFGGKYAY